MSLGFRYLWIDHYVSDGFQFHIESFALRERYILMGVKCINQQDEQNHMQTSQMDEIYSHSVLTIVAAAGEDAEHGLPGVSTRSRSKQQEARLRNVTFLQLPPHTSQTMQSSMWVTRGWTYQEGFFAQRRMIFTDDQVSYLCNEMHYCESIDRPLIDINSSSIKPFQP